MKGYMEDKSFINLLKPLFPGQFWDRKLLDEAELKSVMELETPLPDCSHYHDNSCLMAKAAKMTHVLKYTGRLYFVIHLIPFLLFKRKEFRKNFLGTTLKLLKGWARSMLFIESYCFVSRMGWCNTVIDGKINKFRAALPIFFSTFGILFEAPARRGEIAMYVFPRYIESLKTFLGKMRLWPEIPMGGKLLFGLAIGIIANTFLQDERSVKKHFRWLLKYIMGESDNNDNPEVAAKCPQKAVYEKESAIGVRSE
jgi:hypothetical protein